MKKNGKCLVFRGGLWIVCFIIWTILIQTVDVQNIGQNNTSIGLSTLNSWFHNLTGVHMFIYLITDWLSIVPLFVCLSFGMLGVIQLFKRGSLWKVDYDILILGIYYIVVVVCFILFEIIPMNYRPILIEGILEASYPSSTTLLVLCVMLTFKEQINRRVGYHKLLNSIVILFIVFMVVGRLISGVHWFTDIIGGILLSIGLFYIYKGLLLYYNKDK